MARRLPVAAPAFRHVNLHVVEGGGRTVAVSPVERHIGRRLRLRRTLMGMTQAELAAAIGVSVQQVQKYESGANRLGAERIYQFSRALSVPAAYFFDDMQIEADGSADPIPAALESLDETLDLVRAFYRIANPTVRRRLADLMRAMAERSVDQAAE